MADMDPAGELTGAQSLVKSLEKVGANTVFGIPGGAILPAYDPLYDSEGQPIVAPDWSFSGRGKALRQLQRGVKALGQAEKVVAALPIRGKRAEVMARLEERRDMGERALEYVKAFGGVISQHAQDPDLAGPSACCHEGEVSGRLGLPGWPGIAEEVIVARDVMLARLTGSRVHVAHAHHSAGHHDLATTLFDAALTDCRRALGEDHPITRAFVTSWRAVTGT